MPTIEELIKARKAALSKEETRVSVSLSISPEARISLIKDKASLTKEVEGLLSQKNTLLREIEKTSNDLLLLEEQKIEAQQQLDAIVDSIIESSDDGITSTTPKVKAPKVKSSKSKTKKSTKKKK